MKHLTLILAGGLFAWATGVAASVAQQAPNTPDGSVVFQVRVLDSQDGTVQCGLFKRDAWLKKPYMGRIAEIEGGRATCTFPRVPPGSYAIAAHHDEDSDGALDKFLGVPTEPYCFSSGARAGLGPPSFDSASFRHNGKRTLQRAAMD